MPIYVYKCSSCGFAKDVLQKMSDAPLTVCPSCGKATFTKQLTAAGFQLKGSGWYVTDFREGHDATASASSHHGDHNHHGASSGDEAAKSEGAASTSASDAAPAPAAPSSTSASPPASGGSGSSSDD